MPNNDSSATSSVHVDEEDEEENLEAQLDDESFRSDLERDSIHSSIGRNCSAGLKFEFYSPEFISDASQSMAMNSTFS